MTKFECFIKRSKNNLADLISGCIMVIFMLIAFLPLFILVALCYGNWYIAQSGVEVIIVVTGFCIAQALWLYCVMFPFHDCYIKGDSDA
jgi:hypothetical protein